MEYKEEFLGWRRQDGTYDKDPPPDWLMRLCEAVKSEFNMVNNSQGLEK